MSLKEFPQITAVIAVENSMGGPVPMKFEEMKVFEEGAGAPFYTVIILDKSGSRRALRAPQSARDLQGGSPCPGTRTPTRYRNPTASSRGGVESRRMGMSGP